MQNKLDSIMFYMVYIKNGNKKRLFISKEFDIGGNLIHIKGPEIEDSAAIIDTYEFAVKLFTELEHVEKFFPCSSLIEAETKRLNETMVQ